MDLFSPRHLLVILLICLVVFGTKKLRTIGSDLGGAVRGFKNAMNEGESGANAAAQADSAPDAARLTASAAAAAEPAAKTADAPARHG